MIKTWKILASLTVVAMVGCTDNDGNGPVNIPYYPDSNGGNSDSTADTDPLEVTVGQPLPAWTEGCLDIHSINTGRGESTLYILPDGTTMLIDAAGSLLSPNAEKPPTPSKPNGNITSGAVIIDYIKAYICQRYVMEHLTI